MWSVVSKDEVVVAFEHAEDDGCSARCISLLTCTRRDDVGDVPLTDVSLQLAIRANLSGRGGGGTLGKFLEMRLARLPAMRSRFDRSIDVDRERRKELVEMIKRHASAYTMKEETTLAEGVSWFKVFDGKKSKDVDMRSPLAKGKWAYSGKEDNRAWGWAATTARAR
jgi:hypothetical protein